MQAKQIFLEAIEKHAPDDWERYLDQACGGDVALRQQVTNLLRSHAQINPLLEDGALVEFTSGNSCLERPGMTVGPYNLVSEIGEGGFGVIFRAEQTQPMRRVVALKILKPGVDTRQVVARFEAERQALALMDHPHIARLFDGGVAPSGRPFFAMELVDGLPITKFCEHQGLAIDERLRLFLDVCYAVQHAHLKGIIHRDLKPSNVLVSRSEDRPLVKVIDFGIAKAIGQTRLSEKSILTEASQFLGTPAYMSPEQAASGALDVDTRSDVYSLGVLLYELLASVPPFSDTELLKAGHDEMRRIIRETEPQRPSVKMRMLPTTFRSFPGSTDCGPSCDLLIPRELDWIALKALEKDRGRRYQSAVDFAADVSAFLKGDAVTACPPSRLYRVTKYAKRNLLALVSVATVVSALLASTVISLHYARLAVNDRKIAQASLIKERLARDEAAAREAQLKLELYQGDVFEAFRAWNDGDQRRANELLDRYVPTARQVDLREFSWHYLKRLCDYRQLQLHGHSFPILDAAISPDDKLLASADRQGNICVWRRDSETKIASWNYSNKEVTSLAFSPNGKMLASAGQDRTVRLWDVEDWREVACLRGHDATVNSVSWSPDGTRLASGGRDKSVQIWRVEDRSSIHGLHGLADVVRCVRWTPDGRHLAAAVGGSVELWKTDDWSEQGSIIQQRDSVLAVAISRDGVYLAAGGRDRRLDLFNLQLMRKVARVNSRSNIWSLAFSPDANYLLAGMEMGGPAAWRVLGPEGELFAQRYAIDRSGLMRSTLFDHSGRFIVTATEETSQLQVFDSKELLGMQWLSFPDDCLEVVDRRSLAVCAAPNGDVVLRRLDDGNQVEVLQGHKAKLCCAAGSRSGRWLATSSIDGEIMVWDLDHFQLRHRFEAPRVNQRVLGRLRFSTDDSSLGWASSAGAVRVWSLQSGKVSHEMALEQEDGTRMAFSVDGTRIATSCGELGITLWNSASGDRLGPFGIGLKIYDLQFSPDDQRLYGAAVTAGAISWDTVTGDVLTKFISEGKYVAGLAISPDDKTLVTASSESDIQFWHLDTGRLLMSFSLSSRLNWLQFAGPDRLLIGARQAPNQPAGVFVIDAGSEPNSSKNSR